MPKILIIDDERFIRASLREILEYEKFEVTEAQDGEEGLAKMQEEDFDLVLCDIKMPKMDGIEVLDQAKAMGRTPQFIMISAHGSIETAVEATKKGAFDFIPKPPDLNRLLLTVRNALDKKQLVTETKVLKKKLSKKFDMVGESPAIARVKDTIEKVAPTDARVLITGPNGTGKELVAHWIHQKSNRQAEPFVAVNCAAIPSELIESELFGHEKGAFTSAHKQRNGKFEQAQGGTLFLDEIGDMSLSAQSKVLRALQENLINRVGSDRDIKVDVRVLAATNKDLKKEIEAGRFREDLYHRLSVILVQVPALKDRKEDIPLLVEKFLDDIAQENGDAKKRIAKDALLKLQEFPWTGNIRELRNVIERLVILGEPVISLEDIKKYADY
ncbi:DNA-binding transcriptional response regulator, NtrC family, contains REC, AAA-type ATPase, and a Fis-type DNA-binding domains [Algoriphagus alkaliphilus]|jgi:DNA-binding NtrC family response regulator|uniref:DNA-binding transcriptional response regulator, NtrC family, contains REC, AAA-type ATPase, and a Fis-type DNA-binding domains n=1 Tax=Algoriphagus alkaliphilus TaxID=279824 RepID=A0A1G5ZKU4_9BACT|nr:MULTISPECIES: sigma-54 dependent transcriptional regulator [Algoriphagus]MBA4299908.1 sigma-54-dependent Fis family transcriptional regulator [Cyclobacterium sp.]MDO8965890.1 sigma-54 dependent transcriptional regulator [Algoriphagus sp.]MDP2041601.1 sigma-54 dependent transcriptional regulator [Algoriphagus sp.]MDP3201058.1 sigma-54 dependent transcriptional regulator [Algoriphagus sp.]MDP3473362.1 sigma-54 dependent transcriptional regulator [Algoriphagus sp.]